MATPYTPYQMFTGALNGQGYTGPGTGIDPNAPLYQANGGGTDYSWIAPLITGATDLATSHLAMSDAQRAAGIADPFSGQRGQYQTQLNSYMGANPVNPSQVMQGSNTALSMLMNLLQNPGSLTNMPGYQFGLNQALEGVNRGAGASGLLNSGNRLAALQDRGQSYAQGWQKQIFDELLGNVNANNSVAQLGLNAQNQGYNQLQHLAGADTGSPTAAAQALLNGRTNQQRQLGAGVAGLANAAPGALAAFQRILGSNGGGGWGGAVPGGANDSWDINPVGGGGFDAGFPDNWDLMGTPSDVSGFGDLFSAGDIFGGL